MSHGLSLLDELPVSVRLIKEIHAKLMQGAARGGQLNPGPLRTTQNWIGPAGSTSRDAVFVPPPPHKGPQARSDLERRLHDGFAPPSLIHVGLARAQFQTIRPFLDARRRVR